MTPALGQHWALAAVVAIPALGALFALVMPGDDRLALRHVGLGTSVGTALLVLLRLTPALEAPLSLEIAGVRLSLDAVSFPLLLSLALATPVALRSGAPRVFERTQFYVVTVQVCAALCAAALVIDAHFVRLALAALGAVPLFALVALFGGPLRGTTTLRAAMIWLVVDTAALAVVAWLAARARTELTDVGPEDLRGAVAGLEPALRPWVFLVLAAPGLVRLAAGPFSLWLASFFEQAPVSAALLACSGAAPLGALLLARLGVPAASRGVVPLLPWIAAVAAVAVLLSGVIAVAERDLRRLLAQLVQAAGATAALCLVVLDERALAVGLLHSVTAGASAGLALVVVEAVERRTETRDAAELAGLGQANPLLAALLLLALCALVGVPTLGAGATLWRAAFAVAAADGLRHAGLPPVAAVWLAAAIAAGALLAAVGVAGTARRILQPAPRRKAGDVVEVLTFGQGLRLAVPAAVALGLGLAAEPLVDAAARAARAHVLAARGAAGLPGAPGPAFAPVPAPAPAPAPATVPAAEPADEVDL